MKKLLIAGIVLFVAVWVMAQTFGPPAIGSDGPIATSPSQCPTSAAHGFSICPVETGAGTGQLYISINGSAPAPLVAPAVAGVTSFNGQSGAVTYNPSTVNCSSASLTTGTSLTSGSLSASGCALK